MATTIQKERLRWIIPIVRKEVKLIDVARVCPHGKRSLERWMAVYKKDGTEALIPRSTRPKTEPGETPIHIKERALHLRKKTRLYARKLSWRLGKEGVFVHERTIGKILKGKGLVRKYRVKKVKMKYVEVSFLPGELVEIDVKYVPGTIANTKPTSNKRPSTVLHDGDTLRPTMLRRIIPRIVPGKGACSLSPSHPSGEDG